MIDFFDCVLRLLIVPKGGRRKRMVLGGVPLSPRGARSERLSGTQIWLER